MIEYKSSSRSTGTFFNSLNIVLSVGIFKNQRYGFWLPEGLTLTHLPMNLSAIEWHTDDTDATDLRRIFLLLSLFLLCVIMVRFPLGAALQYLISDTH